jgi:hypothetical protein
LPGEVFQVCIVFGSAPQDGWAADKVAKKAAEDIQNICDLAKQLKAISLLQIGRFRVCLHVSLQIGSAQLLRHTFCIYLDAIVIWP